MAETRNLVVNISGTTSSLKKALSDLIGEGRKAETSLTRLGGAVAAGQFIYSAASTALQRSVGFMKDSSAAANQYQNALLGLNSIARAFGQDQDRANQAAKDLAADGLMSVTQSATGLKNLLASHFSLDESIVLMNRFKDSAAFNRQAALSFGDAVKTATEGIKNGNSILVDNAGVTKNLSVILQEAGKSQQDVMNITSDASVRQALYNGLLKETAAQSGDAARLTQTFAGSQARATAEVTELKQNLGAIVNTVSGPFVQAFTNFIDKNQQAIVSFGLGAVAAIGMGTALFFTVKAIQAFSLASVMAAATNPLIAALTVIGLLAGVVVYKAVGKMQDKLKSTNGTIGQTNDILGNQMPDSNRKAAKSMEDLSEKLAEIDLQINRANRDFQEQLAEMVKGHEDKVKTLGTQLSEENSEFADRQQEQKDTFTEAQDQMAQEHTKKVDNIERQIRQLLAQGKNANQEELADLRAQLAQEQTEYAAQYAKRQADYDKDAAKAQAAHDKKTADLQAQLDAENTLLNQHAADVAGIRNVMMLDEIDKLKRSRTEQLQSLDKQKNDAIKNATDTAAGVSGAWDAATPGLNDNFAKIGKSTGNAMGNAFKDSLKEGLKDVGKGLVNWGGKAVGLIPNIITFNKDKQKGYSFQDAWDEATKNPAWSWRASGGPVSAGKPFMVGEAGKELFVPQESGTIVSNGNLSTMMGPGAAAGAQQVTQHISNFEINLDLGMYVGMPSEKREIAAGIWKEITRLARSQGVQLPQIGVEVQ